MPPSSSEISAPVLPQPLPPHPRLLVEGCDWNRIKNQVESDAPSGRILASLQKRALRVLSEPPAERIMTGYRLLYISRKVLERISILSTVFKITNDPRFARRAIAEMNAVCGFSDWNPSHYLDTAEMSLAVAIGYDWLQDQLNPQEKEFIAQALVEKGINPSLREPKQFFITGNNNWNQVCHAGMTAAAIAIADREPQVAELVIRRALDNLHYSAEAYAPDGAYPEGPMYWNYGTSFHVILAAILERFTGTTQGVDAYPGFAASADYVLQMTTPTGHFYDYADCRPTRHILIPLFWFARHFRRPDWLGPDLQKLEEHLDLCDMDQFDDSNYRLLFLALIWRDPCLVPDPDISPANHWLGQGPMPVAAHRSDFESPDALYAAMKGGSPSLNHAHMDVGSFMIEADGVTWATDLGMQDYEGLEALKVNLWDASENGTRWSVFRLGAEGHNILRFNNAPQLVQGSAHFIRFCKEGSHPHSVLDLTSLYSNQVQSAKRGLMLVENRAVLIQDEWIGGPETTEMIWQMLTPADISIQPGTIYLSKDGKKLTLQLLDAFDRVDFQETSALQQPFDAPNPGIKRITIKVRSEPGQNGIFRVLATPGSSAPVAVPALEPLGSWSQPIS